MNESKLKAMVSEAVELDRDIREKENRLKQLKAMLVTEAESRTDEHAETDGGGSSWQYAVDGVAAVTVSFPAPSLKSSIPGVGKTIEKVMHAAGKAFSRLFEQVPAWKPVPDFRAAAEKELGRGAAKLVKLCESASSPRVAFETKESSED
jgi:hypothetical protein